MLLHCDGSAFALLNPHGGKVIPSRRKFAKILLQEPLEFGRLGSSDSDYSNYCAQYLRPQLNRKVQSVDNGSLGKYLDRRKDI